MSNRIAIFNRSLPILMLSLGLMGVPLVGHATGTGCIDTAVNGPSCYKSGPGWSVFTSLQTGSGSMFLLGGVEDTQAPKKVQVSHMEWKCSGVWTGSGWTWPQTGMATWTSVVSCPNGTQPTQGAGYYAYNLN